MYRASYPSSPNRRRTEDLKPVPEGLQTIHLKSTGGVLMMQIALITHGGMMHYRQACIPEFEERKYMYGHGPGMSEPMLGRGKVYDQ